MDDRDQSDSFIPAINLNDLAYAAPVLGAGLLCCFAISIAYYLWRRICSSRHGGGILTSSSNSYRNFERPAQSQTQRAPGQNQTFGGGRSPRGNYFVSWARDQVRNQRNPWPVRSSQPVRNYQAPQQPNDLRTPMATQYLRATQGGGRVRNDQDPGGTTLSNSEGFSQATAPPPPSYSYTVGYQSVPAWNLPGHGYQSTEPRTIRPPGGAGGEMGQGENNSELPPPYEAAVANGRNARRT